MIDKAGLKLIQPVSNRTTFAEENKELSGGDSARIRPVMSRMHLISGMDFAVL